jgi:hypothetical protein
MCSTTTTFFAHAERITPLCSHHYSVVCSPELSERHFFTSHAPQRYLLTRKGLQRCIPTNYCSFFYTTRVPKSPHQNAYEHTTVASHTIPNSSHMISQRMYEKLVFQTYVYLFRAGRIPNFQNSCNNIKNLSTRTVTWSTFHTDTQILRRHNERSNSRNGDRAKWMCTPPPHPKLVFHNMYVQNFVLKNWQ